MAKLKLNLAVWGYDRVRALFDGSVQPEGIQLNCLDIFVGEIFKRMTKHQEFEVSEMSLSLYANSVSEGNSSFIAIPVFPLRFFRHSSIYVNTNSGIKKPTDLIGKKVGEIDFGGQDAGVWVRGILQDEYGVPPETVTYFVAGLEKPKPEDEELMHSPLRRKDIKVNYVRGEKTLSEMLEDGEIDAIYSALVPSPYLRGLKNVRRLFENYEAVERDYYQKTGIFPIMHTVVIRRDVYEGNRWVAVSLFKAFNEAKKAATDFYKENMRFMLGRVMVPWLPAHLSYVQDLMGEDYWPYGFEKNKKTLETYLRYHYDQGFSGRRLRPEELFAPETLTDYGIALGQRTNW